VKKTHTHLPARTKNSGTANAAARPRVTSNSVNAERDGTILELKLAVAAAVGAG
jgi:hypothetical protein